MADNGRDCRAASLQRWQRPHRHQPRSRSSASMAPVSRRGTAGWQLAATVRSDPVRSSARPRWPTPEARPQAWRREHALRQEPAPGSAAPPAVRERRVNDLDRRALTLRTLLTSGFSPRRRDGRRAGEQELPVDFHEPYLLVLAVVMLLLSVADAFLTVTLMSDGARGSEPAARVRAQRAPALVRGHQDGVDGYGRRVARRNGADQAVQSSSARLVSSRPRRGLLRARCVRSLARQHDALSAE